MSRYNFDYTNYREELIAILQEVDATTNINWSKFRKILARHPKDKNKMFSKNHLVLGYKGLLGEGNKKIPINDSILAKIQMKPVRTQSGVTTVTVLTKPFPCPGKCIFCPNDVRMPKSYLADEPGAQRAQRNSFDPYLQTYRRLQALSNIGHNVSKVELIILGGTWSYYSEGYQIWFIKKCFEALNDFGEMIDQTVETEKNAHVLDISASDLDAKSVRVKTYNKAIVELSRKSKMDLNDKNQKATWEELFAEHRRNEKGKCRNVGLVIETRPDNISPEEVIRLRKLGCTKTQIGIQSLDDRVLEMNKRGHDVAATIEAFRLLRSAGFKIHGHWMANLYGTNLQSDIEDYKELFSTKYFHPDELKIYPCSLIETAELMDYYEEGRWKPYNYDEMFELLSEVIKETPNYVRLTRIIREFSAGEIVDGNKVTNLREVVEKDLAKKGFAPRDIRAREIKNTQVSRDELSLKITEFETTVGEEQFLEFVTKENQIAGFLRLSLPKSKKHPFIDELDESAIIREIHVYGSSINLGEQKTGKAQHLGLGSELIIEAKKIATAAGYKKMAVISAIGTREYYRKRGFEDGEMYQVMNLQNNN